jgi:hypothetical protein
MLYPTSARTILIAAGRPPVTMEGVTAAIVVILILVAIGTVADGLLRLRKWLNKSPSGHDLPPPLDDGSE